MCCATLLRMPVKSARHQKCVVRRRCKAVLRLQNESHVLTTPPHALLVGWVAQVLKRLCAYTPRFSVGRCIFSSG